MSTAQLVPETWELDGDDAAQTLRHARFRRLLIDSIRRFRVADGFSHARSLAFAMVLTVIPGVIALVGLATLAGAGAFRHTVEELLTDISPGPSGELITAAISHGTSEPSQHGIVPLVFGGLAMLISGVTCFGQVERSANRIYGIEQDRPFLEKYGRALALFTTCLLLTGTTLFIVGATDDVDLPGWGPMWVAIKAVMAIVAAAVVIALVFQKSPRRHQPNVSWLVVGSSIATGLWLLSTALLAGFWRLGTTFGETYGPMAGIMALALWAYLIAIGVMLGLAFAAQLEAVRSGQSQPQDAEKVLESEPSATDSPDGEPAATKPSPPALV